MDCRKERSKKYVKMLVSYRRGLLYSNCSTHPAAGIRYLHQEHIVHRDLKPENILLKNYKGKVGDLIVAMVIMLAHCGNW